MSSKKSDNKGFTKKEEEIMNKIVEVHNLYASLAEQHPSDMPEWVKGVHDLQKLMALRILRREHPNQFPIKSR